MIDWKAWIDRSGLAITVAETVRDSITAGINKELERKLEDTQNKLHSAETDVVNYQRDLREARADLEMAQREVTRLKMQIATQPVGAKE